VNAPIWSVEWKIALRRRRLLVFNVAIPLLLVLPISLGGAPPFHAAAAYTVLFALFGTFGSAIPLLRDGDGGPLRRIVLSGFPEPAYVTQRILAGTTLDLLQLIPALALILVTGRAEATVWASAIPALALALLAANLIGLWVAALAGSLAEGALFAAVVSLFVLHGSGVFRSPVPGSWSAAAESVLPYRPLHDALLTGAGGGSAISGVVGGDFLPPVALVVLLFLASVALASPLLRRISIPLS
jgi:hypothetical protein